MVGDPNYDSQAIIVGFKPYIELHVNKPLLQLSMMANLILQILLKYYK